MARKEIWEKPTSWFVYGSGILAALIIIYISYSMYYYSATNEHVEYSRVCEKGRCMEVVNRHMNLAVELCGSPFPLPENTGGYDAVHSHASGHIHFNAPLEYVEDTGELVDPNPLKLGEVMNVLNIRFNDNCFGNYCNEDLCKGMPGTLRMFVNGQRNTEFDQYIWHDKDEILITFN